MRINEADEKKWREEWINQGDVNNSGWEIYLQACRARQVEIDHWKQSYLLEAHHCLVHRKEIESLKAEIAKRDELLREWLGTNHLSNCTIGKKEVVEKTKTILKESEV